MNKPKLWTKDFAFQGQVHRRENSKGLHYVCEALCLAACC